MNILFLDDNDERIKGANKAYNGTNSGNILFTTKTAQGAIDAMKNNSFDLVHLDHDLGGEVYVDSSREDCGMEVVRWIIQNNPDIKVISIHSWNEPASLEMMLRLNAHKQFYPDKANYKYVFWIPFGLKRQLGDIGSSDWDIGNRLIFPLDK